METGPRRSGAVATEARMGTSGSPRTPMPTPCRWRSATAVWTCSRTPVPTATTANPRGVHISVQRSRITRSNWTGGASLAMAGPSCGCIMRTAGRSRWWTPARSPGGPPSMTATCRSARRPGTAARSGWTVPRAVSTSSRRSTAVATTSGSPSTSVPTLRRSSTMRTRSWAGQAHPRRGRHGWNCRRSCGGACTGVRRIPSSAGTLAAWGSAYPRTHFSAAGNALQAYSSRHG